jgi:hypothetical protein
MDLAFINDGYIKRGFIKAVPGLYPSVSFEFRPTTAAQAEIIFGQSRRETNDDRVTTFHSNVIKKHLVSWDVKDYKGNLVPIETDKIRSLHPSIFQKVFSIIVGSTATEDAAQDTVESRSDADMDYEAILNGMSKEAAEVKN